METTEELGQLAVDVRRQQAHLNFAASHQARHAARQGAGECGVVGEQLDAKPKEESAAIFVEAFSKEIADISDVLARLLAEHSWAGAGARMSGPSHARTSLGSSGDDVGTSLDELVDRVKGLRQRTAEATLFLPAYDIRRAHEEAGKLLDQVETTRAEIAPRKKFSFRSRRSVTGSKAGTGLSTSGKAAAHSTPTAVSVSGTESEGDGLGLQGMKDKDVEVKAEDADKDKDFNVSNLDACRVTILHVLGALRLRRLKSCRVVCGPVRGPIYMEACEDCLVVAAGRQLRVHDSKRIDFYVIVASGPIIEDCADLRFAPSQLRYPACEEQLQEAGLSEVVNAWEDVKDFKWHRAQKSPNWNVIPETEREATAVALGTRPAVDIKVL